MKHPERPSWVRNNLAILQVVWNVVSSNCFQWSVFHFQAVQWNGNCCSRLCTRIVNLPHQFLLPCTATIWTNKYWCCRNMYFPDWWLLTWMAWPNLDAVVCHCLCDSTTMYLLQDSRLWLLQSVRWPINTKNREQSSLFGRKLIGDANQGKFLLEKETIEAKQSLPHQEANSEVAIKKALAGRHLFHPLSPTWLPVSLSTTFYIKMPALAHGTAGRDPGVFPWRGLPRRLDYGPPSLRVFRLKSGFHYRS